MNSTRATLDEILARVDSTYSGGYIAQYAEDPDTDHGDLLAAAIVNMIRMGFGKEPCHQLDTAIHYLLRARDDLDEVIKALR